MAGNIALAADSPQKPIDKQPVKNVFEVVHVDIHQRLYPDRWPRQEKSTTVSVPRGAPVTFQFALRAKAKGVARLSHTGNLAGKARLHWLKSIHVEGNTQGQFVNRPGGKVPKGWMKHLIRSAPFDTLAVLVEDNKMPVNAGRTHGVVLEITVPRDAKPGTYRGAFKVVLGNDIATAPFAFRVHRTIMPSLLTLHSVHWLWPQPENLTNGKVPDWWSEQHWQLLEAAGKQLRRFGDDTMFTPLINYRAPLIQITRRKDGTYTFDYSRFDRWVKLFQGLGFRYFSGHHITTLPKKGRGGVYVIDKATGKKQPLLEDEKDHEAWFAFLPTFYKSLHAHLKKKGWIKNYQQCQYDEPRDTELYSRIAALTRKYMPGVRTIDAINTKPHLYSPLVDIQVFNLVGLNRNQKVAVQRKKKGQGVWLYHCTSPYPPYPNRHTDRHLTESRLYPWLCQKLNANGYLNWAANIYRGANEYTSSIGPFPNGSQDPGHPPGDAWFYYRSSKGICPSMRMVSFREGWIDYALLTALKKRDRKTATQLVEKIAPSIKKFERDPAQYHNARTAMLNALDKKGFDTKTGMVHLSEIATQRWHAWRKSRKEYPLAAWSYFHGKLHQGTKEEFELYRSAGLNMVQAPEKYAENVFAAGLGLIVGAFCDVHNDAKELSALVEFANSHPGKVVAYSLKDEPKPEDYPAVARAMAYVYAHDRNGVLPIIDFRPNWAVPYRRWKMSYETCFERFVDDVAPPVLLNCHYPLMRDGTTRPVYYSNIEYFRRIALKNDIGLMGFIQLTAHTNPQSKGMMDYRSPSESDLNWMVNTYLAYGAQGLWYYNWRINGGENWGDGLLDGPTGKPTRLYPMVQKMNKRIVALGKLLIKLKSKRVTHSDDIVPEGTTRYAQGTIAGIENFKGDSFIVSQFYNQDDPKDNAVYLMIVNKQHAAEKSSASLMQSCSFNVYPHIKTISTFDDKTLRFIDRDRSDDSSISLKLGGGKAAILILRP